MVLWFKPINKGGVPLEHDAAAQQMEQLSRDFAACGKGFYTKLGLGIVKYHFLQPNKMQHIYVIFISIQKISVPRSPKRNGRAPHGMKYSAVYPGMIPFP